MCVCTGRPIQLYTTRVFMRRSLALLLLLYLYYLSILHYFQFYFPILSDFCSFVCYFIPLLRRKKIMSHIPQCVFLLDQEHHLHWNIMFVFPVSYLRLVMSSLEMGTWWVSCTYDTDSNAQNNQRPIATPLKQAHTTIMPVLNAY